jgi:transposase
MPGASGPAQLLSDVPSQPLASACSFAKGNAPQHRCSFAPEFTAEIVALCQRADRSIGQVAKGLDWIETAVRALADQAGRDPGARSDGRLTSAERRELAELRRENRRLRGDVEILTRATAILATVSR